MTHSDHQPDATHPNQLLSAAQMQAVDARAVVQGIDSFALMQSAGKAVCDAAVELLSSDAGRILIVAGPGNNGGDGAIAACELRDLGHSVSMLKFVPGAAGIHDRPETPQSDAGKAFARWDGETLECSLHESTRYSQLRPQIATLITQADVIVDALFGAGLSRPLEGLLATVVDDINRSGARVLAVDVPSGLDGNTHTVQGVCVQADATVTFFLYKPAHFLYPGRALCGRKMLAQIGLGRAQLDPDWTLCLLNEPASFEAALPRLSNEGHKFDRGHVLVRSGPVQSTGAARLSAKAALDCGAGLVTLASGQEALWVNASHLTAVMLTPCDTLSQWQDTLQDQRINTVVIGPGNGVDDSTRDCVLAALTADKHCILDADALSCWSDADDRQHLFRSLGSARRTTVMTPHAGEFQRLFGKLSEEGADDVSPSRLHLAREAAVQASAVVVFKGADTVIASPDGRAAINANAPPWLATAGAGDVLAGLIASLIAQGMPAFEAACAAVWMHGQAATELQYPLSAEQLVEQLPCVLRRLSPINC